MPSDKEIKKQFKSKASQDPDKYYATSVLHKEGFSRQKCPKCGIYYWSCKDRKTCDNPECSGGFRFFEKSPVKEKLDYIGVWKKFSALFKKLGYTPIKRYPVTARWRTDADFVQASIYDFQPYVVSGEVEPPANPLVVPQFCLRFNDIDNVGITGAHYTGFVMIGQHAFMPPEKWDQNQYFTDIYSWLKEGLGLPKEEITFHEDAWAGGGNLGPCMEFFSRGLELGNQVYMMYEVTPGGYKELNLKVLDMGMGHERNAWFTQGHSTSYESVFPTVCEKLMKITGIKADKDLIRRFLPYSAYLNVDEVENIEKVWENVAKKLNLDAEELKGKILPLAALYSVGEHARSLLVALSDGALPSNVGGGYNLRVILRRALSFIEQYGWKISLPDVCKWHAEYLKPLFPELSEHLNEVSEILEVEKEKFMQGRQKAHQMISNLVKKEIKVDDLLQLYDSHGISPELVREEAEKLGKKIAVPDNFYAQIAELHEKKEQKHATKKGTMLDLTGIPETNALYFEDYEKVDFKAKVAKQIGKYLLLDKTYFYPTSGGQLHDTGRIDGKEVVDVFKQGPFIVHVLKEESMFKDGQDVEGHIDKERRMQLAQHHTATHIINAAARKVLGSHINQASALKDLDKGRIDITHYRALSEEELEKIEREANRIASEKMPVYSQFMPRTEAEQTFGMNIYQGGAVPGKNLRIVEIPETDIEACGGTHLKNTFEAGKIKIIKASKISDSIVRIEFTAGKASSAMMDKEKGLLEETARILDCEIPQIPGRAKELFEKWKESVKKGKKLASLKLTSEEEFEGDILAMTAEILRTQVENVPKTIKRFLEELRTKNL